MCPMTNSVKFESSALFVLAFGFLLLSVTSCSLKVWSSGHWDGKKGEISPMESQTTIKDRYML